MKDFRFKIPQNIEFGMGSLKKLPEILKENESEHVFLISDRGLEKIGVVGKIQDIIEEGGIRYTSYLDVIPNPTTDIVNEAAALYKECGATSIVALGGGSSMDVAKAVGVLANYGGSITDYEGNHKVPGPIVPMIAIPTTAGTGSEVTASAVITDESRNYKLSVFSYEILPKYAVLDPELTVGLPPQVTATTGMDALCHAVECYTNGTYNTKLENDMCKKAVKLIYDNLYKIYLDGTNLRGRQNMQKAAFYAGRAFTRGCVGYVHAIGHTLGGIYGTPHGLAMSIMLPHVMRAYGSAAWAKLADLCDVCGIEPSEDTVRAKAEAFIRWIEDMKVKMNIPLYPEMIKETDVDQIVEWASREANPLYPTPVVWHKKDFKEFIQSLKA